MKKGDIFFCIFIFTILIIRSGVFLFPQRKIIIDGVPIHHFWIGLVIILLVLLLPKGYAKLRIALFSVAVGLVADELTFILLGGGTVSNYWSSYSVLGTIIIVAIIFAIRKKASCKNLKNNFKAHEE